MRSHLRLSLIGCAAPLAVAAALTMASAPLHAGTDSDRSALSDDASGVAATEASADAEPFPARRAVRALIEKETAKTKLPADIAEAVVFVESRYDSAVIGRVGEIGLMQVRPETALMLGFKGTTAELAKPEINIHYGVTYLAKAWRLADGDLCRALMKYRAGHGEDIMSPLSVTYCERARKHLASLNSSYAVEGVRGVVTPLPDAPAKKQPAVTDKADRPATTVAVSTGAPKRVYARLKQGTPAASRAYWAAHEARVRAIKSRLASKWQRVASR